MMARNSVPYALVRDVLQGANHQGVDIAPLLLEVGIDLQRFECADGRLGLPAFGQLLKNLWRVMNDECAGFLTRPSIRGSFAMMCYAAISCTTLRDAIQRSAGYMRIVNDGMGFDLSENGEEARLTCTYQNPYQLDPGYFILSWFVIIIRWGSWMVDKPFLLNRISFEFPEPDYSSEFSLMFSCPAYFDQTVNQVVFNRAILDVEITQDSASLDDFLRDAPQCLLTQFRSDESLSGQIRRVIQQHDDEMLSFDQVAKLLKSTTYTLRRRLKKEGASFPKIKENLRRNNAQYQLTHSLTSVADIAASLGYSEPAAFNHAFRKWTGLSPGEYRKKWGSV